LSFFNTCAKPELYVRKAALKVRETLSFEFLYSRICISSAYN